MQGHIAAVSSPIRWIKRGAFALRQAPFGLASIVIFYVFTMSVLTALPFIGIVGAALFMPFGTMLVIKATQDSWYRRQTDYQILFALFKEPSQRSRLITVGLIYGAFLMTANFAYALTAMDEIAKWQIQDGRLVWESVFANLPYSAIVITLIIYTIGQMATWFAPALIAWKNMTVTKALFYSFFGCLRNWLAILVLLAIIGAVTAISAFTLSFILNTLHLHDISMFIVVPAALLLTTLSYSTIWPMWEDIYGDIPVENLP